MDIPIEYVRVFESLEEIEWQIEKGTLLGTDDDEITAYSNYLTYVDELKYYLTRRLKEKQLNEELPEHLNGLRTHA